MTTTLKQVLFALTLASFLQGSLFAADKKLHLTQEQFVTKMVTEHQFNKTDLEQLLSKAKKKDNILKAINRTAEGTFTWGRYRKIFLKQPRINGGIKFWKENIEALNEAEKIYGVPPEIIVAILGVETNYGGNTGGFRIIDALYTLGLHFPRRSKFFISELEHFLLLTRDQKIDPLFPTGSYAGAMGKPQFMPSSYRKLAIDFDGDNKADIWKNNRDVIGSVANYFKKNGWTRSGKIAYQLENVDKDQLHFVTSKMKPKHLISDLRKSGINIDEVITDETKTSFLELTINDSKEYWLGLHNFYVISRYNPRVLYTMAVYQLSQEILTGYNKK